MTKAVRHIPGTMHFPCNAEAISATTCHSVRNACIVSSDPLFAFCTVYFAKLTSRARTAFLSLGLVKQSGTVIRTGFSLTTGASNPGRSILLSESRHVEGTGRSLRTQRIGSRPAPSWSGTRNGRAAFLARRTERSMEVRWLRNEVIPVLRGRTKKEYAE